MRSIKRSITAFSLAAAMVVSSVSFGGNLSTVDAAAKQNVITKATYNDGRTVKYSYNKKGLVTKSVAKSSYKTNASGEYDDELEDIVYNAEDVNTTVTTTYKYNKKNKISSKTVKTVTKTTFYDADKTTLAATGAKGTVTDTETAVTKFTYNKKGLATQSVTTTTNTKSGSVTNTVKDRGISGTQLQDGRVIAGYNDYKADGTKIYEDNSDNAYYYDGSQDLTATTKTITNTYTDNGDGTYKETYESSKDTAGYKIEDVAKYYKVITISSKEDKQTLELSKNADGEYVYDGKTIYEYTYTYYDNQGNKYDEEKRTISLYDPTYTVYESKKITADSSSVNKNTNSSESVVSDKKVTTTKYTYDKKKRVKKAVATTVATKTSSGTGKDVEESKNTYSSSKTEDETKFEDTKESTSVNTVAYTYDKKGRAKKVTSSNDGIENSKETSSDMTTKHNYEYAYYKDDGSVASESKESYSIDTYPTTTVVEVVNGAKKTTVTHNTYVSTYSNSSKSSDSSNSREGTVEYTYYANGGYKAVDKYKSSDSGSYTNWDNTTVTYKNDSDGTTTRYGFDKYPSATGSESEYTLTSSSSTSVSSTVTKYHSVRYSDDKETVNERYAGENTVPESYTKAYDKLKAAKDKLLAEATPYNDEKTKTVLATPSKTTTTYAYDKNGNVKSAKASGTSTEIKTVKDATYGNTVYVFGDDKKVTEAETAVTHKFTNKDAMENTVKKGTKNLTKVYTANTSTYDRSKDSGSWIKKAAYTIKSKKASAAKVAKKQQWIIQNGNLNGQVGLN